MSISRAKGLICTIAAEVLFTFTFYAVEWEVKFPSLYSKFWTKTCKKN